MPRMIESQDEEAKPSYATEGAAAAQRLAAHLTEVLSQTDWPVKAGPQAKTATQTLGLYLAASEFLLGLPPAGRLLFLGNLEAACFADASASAPAARQGKLRLTPTQKDTPSK